MVFQKHVSIRISNIAGQNTIGILGYNSIYTQTPKYIIKLFIANKGFLIYIIKAYKYLFVYNTKVIYN